MGEIISNVVALSDLSVEKDPLNELIRQGARLLLIQAIEFELEECIAEFRERRLADGRRSVVRNGDHPERQVQTGIGPVTGQIRKIRARDRKPVFRSALAPPCARKGRSLKAALPWLYLKGVSSGEMQRHWVRWWGPLNQTWWPPVISNEIIINLDNFVTAPHIR